jgi:hypothetical protein
MVDQAHYAEDSDCNEPGNWDGKPCDLKLATEM